MLEDKKIFQEINLLKEEQHPYGGLKLLISAQKKILETHNNYSPNALILYKGVQDTAVAVFAIFQQADLSFLYRTLRYGVECYVDLINLMESDKYLTVLKKYNKEELSSKEYPIIKEYMKKIKKHTLESPENFRFKWKHKLLFADRSGNLDASFRDYIELLYKAGGSCQHPSLAPVVMDTETKRERTYEILYCVLDLLTESFHLVLSEESLTETEKEGLKNYQILTAYEILHHFKNPEDLLDYLLENGLWREYSSLLEKEEAFPRIGFFSINHYFRKPV